MGRTDGDPFYFLPWERVGERRGVGLIFFPPFLFVSKEWDRLYWRY